MWTRAWLERILFLPDECWAGVWAHSDLPSAAPVPRLSSDFSDRGERAWRRSDRPNRAPPSQKEPQASPTLRKFDLSFFFYLHIWTAAPKVRMQVSLVCTDHRGGVSRNTEDRLNRQNANSPNTGTRSKFRAVAMVARSLGQLSVQSVPSSSEQSMKTGMKYR